MKILLAPLIHSFFTDHLCCQRGLSKSSISSYRDAIRQMIVFVSSEKKKPCTQLLITDIDVSILLRYLNHLETKLGNKAQTRNHRLAVIRSFFEYVGARDPVLLAHCQKITSIPFKRSKPPMTHYLERDEIENLLGQFKSGNIGNTGLRHYALILFLYNTGARAHEAANLKIEHLEMSLSLGLAFIM
jgi:site-specific recombinase XerD